MFRFVLTFLYWLLRPIVKWFLRRTTRLCELQRICYGEQAGAPRSSKVEFSLHCSKNSDIKALIDYLNRASESKRLSDETKDNVLHYAVFTISRVKNINPAIHPQFEKSLSRCIEHIWGYRQLFHEVELLRKEAYDAENMEHERKLLLLWDHLMPSVSLESRVTKQWQSIGFQGDDPKTDFRGMGLLGLENLLYFAQEYPGAASHVLSHSHHPQYGYEFAVVGINLTSMAYHLLKDGTAKSHFYNVSRGVPTIRLFHQFYCYLFYEFDRFWIEAKPVNVMDFTFIKDKFEKSIRSCLENSLTVFRINVSVDDV